MNIEYVKFGNGGRVPKHVYKYRSWANDLHKSLITSRKTYFASPLSFDDPLDCKIMPDYSLLTKDEIYKKYLELSRTEHPNWPRQRHRKHARDWTKHTPLKDTEHIKELQEEHFKEFNSRFGVLSMTANSGNIRMWDAYSDNHSGFCVGFNFVVLFNDPAHFGGGGQVVYYDELPVIHPNAPFAEQSCIQTFSKERKWEFEEEYRLHKFWESAADDLMRTAIVPREAYSMIIFGAKMEKQEIREIIDIAEINELPVQYKQAVLGEREISIIDYS